MTAKPRLAQDEIPPLWIQQYLLQLDKQTVTAIFSDLVDKICRHSNNREDYREGAEVEGRQRLIARASKSKAKVHSQQTEKARDEDRTEKSEAEEEDEEPTHPEHQVEDQIQNQRPRMTL